MYPIVCITGSDDQGTGIRSWTNYPVCVHNCLCTIQYCVISSRLTVVGLDKLLDQVQPEASTAVPPRSAGVHLLEGTKDLLEFVSRYPQAGISNRDEDGGALGSGRHGDGAGTCEFSCEKCCA